MGLQPNSSVSQQLALPLFTLRAVCPYFSFTASFMSVPAIPLLLLADLNDILRFQSLVGTSRAWSPTLSGALKNNCSQISSSISSPGRNRHKYLRLVPAFDQLCWVHQAN